ncbi:hypothetical protein Dimus_020743 [Dionaea muscipula]
MGELAWKTESLIYRSRVSPSDSREAEELALGVGDRAYSARCPRMHVAVHHSPSRRRSLPPPRASSPSVLRAYRQAISINGAEARGGDKGSQEGKEIMRRERVYVVYEV